MAAAAILAGVVLLPALLDRMPRSNHGGGAAGLGATMGGVGALFNPPEQHVEAARRQRPGQPTIGEPDQDPDAEAT